MSEEHDLLKNRLLVAFVRGTNRDRTTARGTIRRLANELDAHRINGAEQAAREDGTTWAEVGENIIEQLEGGTNGPATPSDLLGGMIEAHTACGWSAWADAELERFENEHGPLGGLDDDE